MREIFDNEDDAEEFKRKRGEKEGGEKKARLALSEDQSWSISLQACSHCVAGGTDNQSRT